MPQKRAKEYYDGIAAGYDELYRHEQMEKYSSIPKLSGKTLDIGAGTGLLNEFMNVDVSADLSPKILRINKSRMKVCCSVTHLPFKENAFDNVVSITVMQDLSKKDMERAVSEISRISSGKCVVSIMGASSRAGFFQELLARNYGAEFIESGRDILGTFSSKVI